MHCLTGGEPLEQLIQPTGVNGLFLLPSGTIPPNPSELLASDRMRELLEVAERRFDLVIVDTPPLLAVTDASVLGSMVDGVVLCLHAGRVQRGEAIASSDRLRVSGARVLGTVLNRYVAGKGGDDKHYYYYYRTTPTARATIGRAAPAVRRRPDTIHTHRDRSHCHILPGVTTARPTSPMRCDVPPGGGRWLYCDGGDAAPAPLELPQRHPRGAARRLRRAGGGTGGRGRAPRRPHGGGGARRLGAARRPRRARGRGAGARRQPLSAARVPARRGGSSARGGGARAAARRLAAGAGAPRGAALARGAAAGRPGRGGSAAAGDRRGRDLRLRPPAPPAGVGAARRGAGALRRLGLALADMARAGALQGPRAARTAAGQRHARQWWNTTRSVLADVALAATGGRSRGARREGCRARSARWLAAAPPLARAVDPFYNVRLQEGIAAAERGAHAEAVRSLRIACFGMLDDEPQLADCLLRLALAQAAGGDQEGFSQTFRRVVEGEELVGLYSNAGLPADLTARFEAKVVEWIPRAALATSGSFKRLAADQRESQLAALAPKARRERLAKLEKEEPNNARWPLLAARLEKQQGDAKAALAAADRALKLSSDLAEARCLRGWARAGVGRFAEAAEDRPLRGQRPGFRRRGAAQPRRAEAVGRGRGRWRRSPRSSASSPASATWRRRCERASPPAAAPRPAQPAAAAEVERSRPARRPRAPEPRPAGPEAHPETDPARPAARANAGARGRSRLRRRPAGGASAHGRRRCGRTRGPRPLQRRRPPCGRRRRAAGRRRDDAWGRSSMLARARTAAEIEAAYAGSPPSSRRHPDHQRVAAHGGRDRLPRLALGRRRGPFPPRRHPGRAQPRPACCSLRGCRSGVRRQQEAAW